MSGIYYSNDPVSYCMGRTMEQKMMFGGDVDTGIDGKPCQAYMAKRCAKNWDGICEAVYQQTGDAWPGSVQKAATFGIEGASGGKTGGDQVLALTAREKFRTQMLNDNTTQCMLYSEPFDYTRPDSPSISYYEGDCIPEYEVNPLQADSDPVLMKILDRPDIAPEVLLNLYNTAKRKGRLPLYKDTRLGKFFNLMDRGGQFF